MHAPRRRVLIPILTTLFVLGCLRMPWLQPSADRPLKLFVTPRVGLAPVTVRVQILVKRSRLNRRACQLVQGFDTSCWSINGEDDVALFFPRSYRLALPGEHEVIAWVEGPSGHVLEMVRSSVIVQ